MPKTSLIALAATPAAAPANCDNLSGVSSEITVFDTGSHVLNSYGDTAKLVNRFEEQKYK